MLGFFFFFELHASKQYDMDMCVDICVTKFSEFFKKYLKKLTYPTLRYIFNNLRH